MQIDDYVIGSPKNDHNFCYTLERKLDGLGRIIGATAFKFGVYYGQVKEDLTLKYRFTQKFGETYQEAFEEVRKSILNLLEAGENGDIDLIVDNKLSAMFKGKILCSYHPDRYLNVFSPNHLEYFLTKLDIDNKNLRNDAVYKREALIEFKNQDPIMKRWSVDLFSDFLYTEYPGRPPKNGIYKTDNVDVLSDFSPIFFPANPTPSFIDLTIAPPAEKDRNGKYSHKGKPDYEKESRKLKELGDRGEKIVVDAEIQRLNDAGKENLAKKVKRVSLDSDSLGYDVLSFEITGEKRYIEVKATNSKAGSANFFFTANEWKVSKENENYYIYMVYEANTEHPKIWPLQNPFNPENKDIIMTPVNFRVTINANQ